MPAKAKTAPRAPRKRPGPPVKPDGLRARSINISLPGPVVAYCERVGGGRAVDGLRKIALAAAAESEAFSKALWNRVVGTIPSESAPAEFDADWLAHVESEKDSAPKVP